MDPLEVVVPVVVPPPVRDEIGENSVLVEESLVGASACFLIFFARIVSMFFVKTVFGISGWDTMLSEYNLVA
jgi:hypothetical protein